MGADQIDAGAALRRRDLLKTAAALPLAAILANPALAELAAATTSEQTLKTASGRMVKASLAVPASTPAPALILIHEFWGLNDQIKTMAAEFAKQGYLALAVDLYDGKVGKTQEEARGFMSQVKPEEATDTLVSWAKWLSSHKQGTGKLGSVGWCFGGGWSMETGIEAGTGATVVYYGKVDQPVERFKKLKGPVLGHFATRDTFINKPMVDGFEANMKAAGRQATVHWYEAEHAFANPTSARYDEADAKLAWERTTAFLAKTLKA
jgi:carboxymethylenebutenolidase